MKSIYLKILILTFLVFGISCEKENQNIQAGNYTGTFKVVYIDGREMAGAVTLELNSPTFYCSGNKNRIPAGGSGTYSFEKNTVSFTDKNAWTADFDPGLILNMKYDYTFDGKKLKMRKFIGDYAYYEYDLTKGISASE